MPTPGERLKQAREARKLTLKQAVQATRIRSYYLEALENDDLAALPLPRMRAAFCVCMRNIWGWMYRNCWAQNAPKNRPPRRRPLRPRRRHNPHPRPNRLPPKFLPRFPPADSPAPPREPAASERRLLEIGRTLRERRELLSLTLDEIERHTRIRRHHLEKIEAGAFDELPSPVQARGLLSAYASFLDLDAEALLLRFAEALQMRRQERQPPPPPRKRSSAPRLPLWLKQFLSADLIFGGGMILLLFGMAVWGGARLLPTRSQAAEAATEGPSISEVLLASPEGGETPTPEAPPPASRNWGRSSPPMPRRNPCRPPPRPCSSSRPRRASN